MKLTPVTLLLPRRTLGRLAAQAAFLPVFGATLAGSGAAKADPVRGGTLTMNLNPEPPILVSALNSAAPVAAISPKIFDGLVTYDKNFKPIPMLATGWSQTPDGLAVTFKLRPGVTWHDGQPFTSADVQYTFLHILKKLHSRGTTTYANLADVETPDPLTAVFKLSAPSPYIMRALAGAESPVLPKHIYDNGTDPLKNPANTAPVGTGPFKFAEFQRGNYLRLVRNPTYWNKGEPYLDQLVVRFIPDSAAREAALESGELQYGAQDVVPLSDVAMIAKDPNLVVSTDGWEYNTSVIYFEFNLRKTPWSDVRVRQAIVRAIDKNFIVKNIWHGFADPADGPVTEKQAEFHTTDVAKYPFDLNAAGKALDAAGYPRKADGFRFAATINYSPSGDTFSQTAEMVRQNLTKIGVNATLQTLDGPTYLRKIWTANDFDLNIYSLSNIADPAIGIQRMYWSKTIQKGVPYSNGSGYSNPEMDQLLVSAQTEVDPAKRKQLYVKMQQLEMTDLPNYPLVYVKWFAVFNKKVHGMNTTALGFYENFAGVYLDR